MRCWSSQVSQFGSRSALPVSSMASKPENPGRDRNQNGSLRSAVASVHRAIDRDDPPRVPGSLGLLDRNRSGAEAVGL